MKEDEESKRKEKIGKVVNAISVFAGNEAKSSYEKTLFGGLSGLAGILQGTLDQKSKE